MNILIIDAQGGGIGRQLVAAIRENLPEAETTAAGTNTAATAAMLKAGAQDITANLPQDSGLALSPGDRVGVSFRPGQRVVVQ